MIQDGSLKSPGMDLTDSYRTMELIFTISNMTNK